MVPLSRFHCSGDIVLSGRCVFSCLRSCDFGNMLVFVVVAGLLGIGCKKAMTVAA